MLRSRDSNAAAAPLMITAVTLSHHIINHSAKVQLKTMEAVAIETQSRQ